MADRELGIIEEARVTLNDTQKQRWSDKRLMKLLNDAQQELCREVPLIVEKITINAYSGAEEYELPEDAVKILTARCNGHVVPTTSMEEMDNFNPDWEDDYGFDFTALVVNNLSHRVIRPYPKLSREITSLELTVRYSAKPDSLGWDETTNDSINELAIADTWDFALTQYVISKAFIDYGDTSSLSRAQVAQGLYTDVFNKAKKEAKKSFSKRAVTTNYRAKVVPSRYRGDEYGSSCSRH